MSAFGAATIALGNNGRLIRLASAPLRRLTPILVLGRRVVVLRHDDVVEVLERDRDFTVAEINGPPMLRVTGPFILSMDRSPQYERERSILQAAVHPSDVDRIRASVRVTAARLAEAGRARGRIDVVRDLARPAAIELVGDYFGVHGPDQATMARWMRTIFHEAFLNVDDDEGVRRAAVASGVELHAHVDDLVAERERQLAAGDPVPDDVLTRLVQLQADEATRLGDEGIRRGISGIIVGAVETTSKAVAHIVDELFRRPAALSSARAAALAGDDDAVRRHAFEALRFNPISPVLVRYVARSAVVAAGASRRRSVREGQTIYAAILPAMFDPKVFRRPNRFDADRPAGDLLHFGGGLHPCFGRYVNLVQIPELVAALLRLDGLRVPDGVRRRISYAGPFPDRFELLVGA
jgi:cytochrome P450